MRFDHWLSRQTHRDDTVGEIARQIQEAGGLDAVWDTDPWMWALLGLIEDNLRRRGFWDAQIGAVREAWLEYQIVVWGPSTPPRRSDGGAPTQPRTVRKDTHAHTSFRPSGSGTSPRVRGNERNQDS